MAAYFSCIMVNLFIFHVLPYSNSFFSFRFVSFLISCVRSRYIYLFTFVVSVIITVAALIYCYWFFVILHQFRIDHHHQLIESVRYLANKHAQTYTHCALLLCAFFRLFFVASRILGSKAIWAKRLKWNWIQKLRAWCQMKLLFVYFWLWQTQ